MNISFIESPHHQIYHLWLTLSSLESTYPFHKSWQLNPHPLAATDIKFEYFWKLNIIKGRSILDVMTSEFANLSQVGVFQLKAAALGDCQGNNHSTLRQLDVLSCETSTRRRLEVVPTSPTLAQLLADAVSTSQVRCDVYVF